MKTIIISIFSLIIFISVPLLAAPPQNTEDLYSLKESGLSDDTLSRFLTQNLANRAAPPLDSQFLARLAQYGGDHLARTYLELDKISFHEKKQPLSQADITKLMNSKLPPAEIQMIISEKISAYKNAQKRASTQLMPPAMPPSASAEGGGSTILVPIMEITPDRPSNREASSIARLNRPTDPQIMVSPTLPEPAQRPAGHQNLRPGQAADPASRQDPPYSTYDIRNNRQSGDVRRHNPGGPWVGVVEKELPDGHVVEANSIGMTSQVGQEVYSRPSGHKVYRYYSGNPDNPRSGSDPRQEAVNRDNLHTIFQNRSISNN